MGLLDICRSKDVEKAGTGFQRVNNYASLIMFLGLSEKRHMVSFSSLLGQMSI